MVHGLESENPAPDRVYRNVDIGGQVAEVDRLSDSRFDQLREHLHLSQLLNTRQVAQIVFQELFRTETLPPVPDGRGCEESVGRSGDNTLEVTFRWQRRWRVYATGAEETAQGTALFRLEKSGDQWLLQKVREASPF